MRNANLPAVHVRTLPSPDVKRRMVAYRPLRSFPISTLRRRPKPSVGGGWGGNLKVADMQAFVPLRLGRKTFGSRRGPGNGQGKRENKRREYALEPVGGGPRNVCLGNCGLADGGVPRATWYGGREEGVWYMDAGRPKSRPCHSRLAGFPRFWPAPRFLLRGVRPDGGLLGAERSSRPRGAALRTANHVSPRALFSTPRNRFGQHRVVAVGLKTLLRDPLVARRPARGIRRSVDLAGPGTRGFYS